MADNIYVVNLDVDKKFNLINDVVVMRQGETGVKIVAKLFNHNKDFGTISKATFSCVKPDGHVVIDDSATVSGSTITYTLNQQVGAASGDIETAYFTINSSVTTSNITIRVISDADSSLDSSDYVDGIDALKEDLAKKLKDLTDEYNKKYSDILTQIKNIDVSDELTKALGDLTAKYDVKIQELLGMINDIDISDELHKAIQEQLDAVKAEFNAAVKNANDNANTKLDQLIKLIETVQSKIDLANQKIKDADTALSNLANEVTKIDGFLEQQHKLIWDDYIKYRNTLQVDFDSFKDSITASVSTLTTDISELQARADKISEELQSVDLTLMQKNRTDIDRLEPVINTAIQTATVNGKTVEKSGTELTITVPDPDLSGYAKSSDVEKLKHTVDSAVQTATVNGEEVTKKGTQLEIEVPEPDLSEYIKGATFNDKGVPVVDNILKIIDDTPFAIDKSNDSTFNIDDSKIESNLYIINSDKNQGTFPENSRYYKEYLIQLKQDSEHAFQILFHYDDLGIYEMRDVGLFTSDSSWHERMLSKKILYGRGTNLVAKNGINKLNYTYQAQMGILSGDLTLGSQSNFYEFTDNMKINIKYEQLGTLSDGIPVLATQNLKSPNSLNSRLPVTIPILVTDKGITIPSIADVSDTTPTDTRNDYYFYATFFTTTSEFQS